MRHLLLAILLRHPVEHTTTAIIIEVDIDIGQRDTVGIQETLEQQVILDGVNLRDAEAVCHSRARSRATTRAYRYIKFLACRADEVLYDKEVTRETHGLHDVQLEA